MMKLRYSRPQPVAGTADRLGTSRWHAPAASVGCFMLFFACAKSLTRNEAIRWLQTGESGIRRLGVRQLALFGSVLCNEARSDSDVDMLVEFATTYKTFDHFMALVDLREDTLEHRVEVGNH